MAHLLFRRVSIAVLTAVALLAGEGASAQAYPSRPIRLIVPYAPGGGVDIVARTLGDDITKRLGKPVIVDNRTGAGGNVGSTFVAKSEPDGYTLLLGSNANAVNNNLYSNMQYDAATDLTQIVLVDTVPMVVLASPTIAPSTVGELIALAKAKPGTLNFGSGGNGTAEHLAFELFKRRTGIEAQHIPYRGGAAVYTDLIGGQIQLMFNNQLGATPYIRSGQLRALGITGNKRSPQLPEVPTFREQGVTDFSVFVWWGVIGPAGIPKDTVAQINQLFGSSIASPDVKKRLESLGAQPQGGTAEEFAAFFRSEMATWAGVIKAANIRIDQ